LVAQDVRTISAVDETKQLAWVVLLAAHRTQAKDSTIRLVVPRAPEVAEEMGMEPTEDRMVAVEEYLLERGYIASVDIGLTRGTYTITPAGLRWLDESLQEPPEAPEMAAAEAERAEEGDPAAGDWETTSSLRSWWRRMFGG
jgi:hypothetical protein